MAGPFSSETVVEVALERAPLARVFAQARIPGMLTMQGSERERAFEAITAELGTDYPVSERLEELQVDPAASAGSNVRTGHLWRLRSGDDRWQVTVGETFVTLDVQKYRDRDEFIERLSAVLDVYGRVSGAPYTERLGVRYVNRLDDQADLLRIDQLMRPEAVGGLAVPRDERVVLARMLCESVYVVDTHLLLARWGLLPPGAVVDPVIPPAEFSSWIIDLDSFTEERQPWGPGLADTARTLATTAYRYFRWVVTDEFIETYRGAS